jgi:regulator of protease activity HflC (stomatin/prohibitin superfamily)
MADNLAEERVPLQSSMNDSRASAEAEAGSGAGLENSLNYGLGNLYEMCCCICAGAGLTLNMATVQQGHVGVVTSFGRFVRILPAGRHRFNIMSETVTPISLMTNCLDVPKQEMMSSDNLLIKVDAVCYYRVVDAVKAHFEVDRYGYALMQLILVTLRTVLGEYTLQEILTERQKLNARVQDLLDHSSRAWGLQVERVEMKGVDINENMQRAMAAKTEANQEAEAKVIQARAQRDSAMILVDAAKKMDSNPGAMKLQWFETLRIIATQGHNTTLILPDNVETPPKQ